MTIFSDKTLSQKLECTKAWTNFEFVEARKILFPKTGAKRKSSEQFIKYGECVKI